MKEEKNWEEEFNKKFVRKDETGKYRDDWFVKDYIPAKDIKKFISNFLQKQRDKTIASQSIK
jgi:hypothetical protein